LFEHWQLAKLSLQQYSIINQNQSPGGAAITAAASGGS
jgi:hypothetical protein